MNGRERAQKIVQSPLDSIYQADRIMQPAGIIKQLVHVHGNLDALTTLPARIQASAARATWIASSDWHRSARADLYGFVDCRGIHGLTSLTAVSTAPITTEVERIREQSCGSFQGNWITGLSGLIGQATRPTSGLILPAVPTGTP